MIKKLFLAAMRQEKSTQEARLRRPTRNRKYSLLLSMLSLTLLLTNSLSISSAQAANFYVSKASTAQNPDGSSYTKAWKELRDINWQIVTPGSTIYIDGGVNGLVYTTSLINDFTSLNHASGTATAPISILQSPDNGHNGPVTIDGQSNLYYSQYGIYLNGVSNIIIKGSGKPTSPRTIGGIEIKNQAYGGAYIRNSTNCSLSSIEIDKNYTYGGLILNSNNNLTASSLLIHDNSAASGSLGSVLPGRNGRPNNLSVDANYAKNDCSLSGCWVYNSNSTQFYDNGVLAVTGGVEFSAGPPYTNSVKFNGCAFGPFVDTNVGGYSTSAYTQCLFVQPNVTTFNIPSTNNTLGLGACTSFIPSNQYSWLPPAAFMLESNRYVHNNISVNSSTIYGGTVSLIPGQVTTDGANWQYNTSGSTVLLGDHSGNRVTQPPFLSDVSSYNSGTSYLIDKTINFYGGPKSPVPAANSWQQQTIQNLTISH